MGGEKGGAGQQKGSEVMLQAETQFSLNTQVTSPRRALQIRVRGPVVSGTDVQVSLSTGSHWGYDLHQ